MLLSDKANYLYQLYQVLQQYPESLLVRVFTTMKEDGMVAKIKQYVRHFCQTGQTKPDLLRLHLESQQKLRVVLIPSDLIELRSLLRRA